MKFSAAIRLGSQMNKPTKKGWYGRNEQGEMETCAIVAGMIGGGFIREGEGVTLEPVGKCETTANYDKRSGTFVNAIKCPAEWMAVAASVEPFPCGCNTLDNVWGCIQHLHDEHQWTREAAADWVEKIEKKFEATGDKGAEAGDEKVAPPPCSQEILDSTPAEVK